LIGVTVRIKASPIPSLILSLLLAAVMAVGILAWTPPAQTQEEEENVKCGSPYQDFPEGFILCLSKIADTNPATVGRPLTFTLTVFFGDEFCNQSICGFLDGEGITDTLPSSVRFVEATANNGATCTRSGNTVECAPLRTSSQEFPGFAGGSFEANIEVIPEQCGTFTNTATAPIDPPEGGPVTVSLPFTVKGCEEPNGAGGGAGAAAPLELTQETEQEAESGDIDQSFDVSQTGDNSEQCAGLQGAPNTGNPQNVTDLLQAASDADDFGFEEVGSDVTVSPESPTTCDQQGNQAASASG
jgi:hypothetical protein